MDETYIGGKARNMHASKRRRIGVKHGRSTAGKTVVMGLLQRHGTDRESKVRALVVDSLKRQPMQARVREIVELGASVYTDALASYWGLAPDYAHQVADHAERYVDGQVHTNGMENFWSLFKRGVKGTYVSVEPFHLFRYVDEQAFRFNTRKGTDAERFSAVVCGIVGRRLTYTGLTGNAVGDCPN